MRPDLHTLALDVVPHEILRDLDVDARAIAGLAVRVDGAAMPHRLQRGEPGFNDAAPRFAVDGGDQPDAARIMLVLRRVEPGLAQQAFVRRILADEAFAVIGMIDHVD